MGTTTGAQYFILKSTLPNENASYKTHTKLF